MRSKMTLRKLVEMITSRRGMGTCDAYTPWILPTKRDTSPISNQSYVPTPMLRRHSFFMSSGERHLAHVLWWLGVVDVREQFPLWPWPHPSPMAEIAPDQDWPGHPGMDEVAKRAGIPVYTYPGLSVSHVLTIDLMVTVQSPSGEVRLLGLSCKPRELYERAPFSSRLRERLELDRRYCATAGIEHLLVHPEQLPRVLVRQLEWLAPLAPRERIQWLIQTDAYQTFVRQLKKTVHTKPAWIAASDAGKKVHWNQQQIRFATHTAIWRQDVAVDLSTPLSMSSPLPAESGALRRQLKARLLGESA